MKLQNLALVLSICCLPLSSCSKDNDENDSNYENGSLAPTTLSRGIKIEWEGTYTYSGQSKRYGESGAIEILNTTDCQPNWSVDWGTYTYEKTGENTATLSFSVMQNAGGHVRSFQYKTILAFSSRGEFTMTGSKYVFSNMNGGSLLELQCTGTIN